MSTLISISIEQKIKSKKKISENNLLIDIASLSVGVLPRKTSILLQLSLTIVKKNNEIMFYLYFTKSGIIFDERDLYFFGTARLANLIEDNYEKIEMFSDISSFEDDIIINDDYKNYLKIKEEIKNDQKKFTAIYK